MTMESRQEILDRYLEIVFQIYPFIQRQNGKIICHFGNKYDGIAETMVIMSAEILNDNKNAIIYLYPENNQGRFRFDFVFDFEAGTILTVFIFDDDNLCDEFYIQLYEYGVCINSDPDRPTNKKTIDRLPVLHRQWVIDKIIDNR